MNSRMFGWWFDFINWELKHLYLLKSNQVATIAMVSLGLLLGVYVADEKSKLVTFGLFLLIYVLGIPLYLVKDRGMRNRFVSDLVDHLISYSWGFLIPLFLKSVGSWILIFVLNVLDWMMY